MHNIEACEAIDTPHRAKQAADVIFRYALATSRAGYDPSRGLAGALISSRRTKHHASITDPKQIGELLRAIGSYQGTIVVNAALKISILLFQRLGEVRHIMKSLICNKSI